MKNATTVLYWMVLGGHALAVLSTIVYVGTWLPAQSQAKFGLVILIIVAGGVAQVAAFYLQAVHSAHFRYRWWVATPMMVVTGIFTIGSVLATSPDAYYVTTRDVASTLLAALVSCGALTWLRQARSSATTRVQ